MSPFTDAVEIRLKGLEAVSAGGCSECLECDDDSQPSFSWNACEGCGSSLGGDRHPGHGLIPNAGGSLRGAELVHLDICTDCLLYLANGDEPDDWEDR